MEATSQILSRSPVDRLVTVTCDFSVSLHACIMIVDDIYIFFLSIYIKSLRSHTRPNQGKSALLLTPIGPTLTDSGASAYSRTIYTLKLEGIYDILSQYISAIEDTEIAYDCINYYILQYCTVQ